jgi:hypothetical protein
MTDTNNPPAFPRDYVSGGHNGMTLRDYFAAQIINGYVSDPTATNRPVAEVAEWAYNFADAMIEARGE